MIESKGWQWEIVTEDESNVWKNSSILKTKRMSAMLHKEEFEAEGHKNWFDMLIGQTECVFESYEQFRRKMARYIFVIKK